MRAALAAVLLAAALPATAAEEPEIFHDSQPDRWGAPARIVQPEFPSGALAGGITGYVDFESLVDEEGRLREVEYRAGSKDAEAFVPALKAVVPHWIFHPAIGRDCMPFPRRYTTRVWFEIDGGKPRITATRRRGEEPFAQPEMSVVERSHPRYPSRMQRLRMEALVYARMEITPEGRVPAVATLVFPRDPDLSEFGYETEKALRRWKWTPAPEGYTRTRIACRQVQFRLSW